MGVGVGVAAGLTTVFLVVTEAGVEVEEVVAEDLTGDFFFFPFAAEGSFGCGGTTEIKGSVRCVSFSNNAFC